MSRISSAPVPTGALPDPLSFIWALDDFTDDNGATRVVLDSHRPNDVRFSYDDSSPADMPRGSVVLYLGSTYHGGGANTTDRLRIGINVDYVLGWHDAELSAGLIDRSY